MSELPPVNQAQATQWNAAGGEAWVDLQPALDRMLAPFADRLIAEGFPGPGRRVLDVGCGAGATTLGMARKLGAGGLCLGADISGPLVAAARARASAEGVDEAGFVQADAQTFAFEPASFDAVISRFGVMFFDDPVAAFANLRRAARPGARLAFVAWRSPAENPFFTTAVLAAAPFLPPFPPPVPDAPGQFAFADDGRVRQILQASGWSDARVDALDLPCGVDQADLQAYLTRLGPVGLALRQADDPTRERVMAALDAAYRPFLHDGEARFSAACWMVTARA